MEFAIVSTNSPYRRRIMGKSSPTQALLLIAGSQVVIIDSAVMFSEVAQAGLNKELLESRLS